jgi:autotransporter passenger strand-loop-strand repeat protein
MPTISVTSSQPDLVASSGVTLDVLAGGTLVGGVIENGGSAIIEVGGDDAGSTISAGGAELVLGSASGDSVAGSQTVSVGSAGGGVITNEAVLSGGSVLLAVKSTSAGNVTVDAGGLLAINGNISANDTTLSGGTVDLESAKATLTGTLVFAGGGQLEVTGNTSAGFGDLAVISGFGTGDTIDITSGTSVGAAGTSATSSIAVSGGDTTITVSGGGSTQSFIFAGTAIGASLILLGDGNGGVEVAYASAGGVSSVGSGPPQSNLIVASGATLTVYSGGTIVSASVLAGGSAVIQSGGTDSGTDIAGGGVESVLGSASDDTIFGTQTVGPATGAISNETVENGGNLVLSGGTASDITVDSGGSAILGNATISNVTISGGTVALDAPGATLSGTVTFGPDAVLDIGAASATGAGVEGVISGFYTSDEIVFTSLGSGATLSTSTSGGDTIAVVSGGGTSEQLTFAGDITSNLTLSNTTSGEVLSFTPTTVPTTSAYTPGDLVLSIYGDGAGTGSYGDNQASPITLQEITTTGSIVSQLVLPQTTRVVNGVTEYAISGEYGSSSEGLLTLSLNGQSLTIAGYGITATAFNVPDAAAIYGNTALAQTTSLTDTDLTPVARVIADISYNTTIDTSTALYNVYDTNNPRSVITVNGTSFYISGQGADADGTEGVFLAEDGASGATPIYNSTTDTRDIEFQDGQLYVSIDSKLNEGGGLYTFGSTLPTSATTPSAVPGIGPSVVLTSGTANTVNGADIGASVYLSPEQYFFADPTTLYIADGGNPKEGGLGDGGLQKWSLIDGQWVLDYTLSEGLNLVPDTDADGSTGLIGLAGTVVGNQVMLYATNETAADTDQTYLYAITDTLGATTLPTDESFTVLETAAPDTLIRGVSFAPTSSSTIPEVTSTLTISNTVTSTGLTVASGGEIIVLSGGKIVSTTVLAGGSAVISLGGVDDATTIAQGGNELVLGSATADVVEGTQTVSNASAVVTSDVVENGGALDLSIAGAIANDATVYNGGSLNINGHAFADNTVIDGGVIDLQSPKATLSGSLTFSGTGGTILVTGVTSAGYGDLAPISGFAAGDVIDERVITFSSGPASSATLSTTVSGGKTVATITSGAVSESFTFVGSTYSSGLSLTSDGAGGTALIYTPPPPQVTVVSPTVTSTSISATSGGSIIVLSGGTLVDGAILSGGSAVVSSGGIDSGSTISSGGFELVSGSATGDRVYGVQLVSGAAQPATVSNETVFNGGTIELFLKPDIGTDIMVSSGGTLLLSGNVSATDTTLEAGALMALQSPKATLTGSLVFSGAAKLAFTAVTSPGFGDFAVISGFGAGDIIDETLLPANATLSTTVSGGNTVETISGGGFPESFVFAGTTIGANIQLVSDGGTGVELDYVACFRAGTRIATAAGEVPVQMLRAGDAIRTASGELRPAKWIGRRTVDCARHPRPDRVWPVCVAAGAFAAAEPCRDLYLSPDHAVFVDGALVPVAELVNGTTIRQVAVDRVTYYHVELDRHDVILAEGLATESFLDTGNRDGFENGGGAVALHPSFFALSWENACAELVVYGPQLAAIRARLARRAAALGCAAALAPMHGYVIAAG